MTRLRAPFPFFGGKSRVAHLVWERFGDVPNYVEPFAGSLAVLLGRPHAPRVETVNDKDMYIANAWRALQANPEKVAYYADWPVNEADLHARHFWLVNKGRQILTQILKDPHFYDAKIAGWWLFGQCLWIGSGWCAEPGWRGRVNAGRAARGIHSDAVQDVPHKRIAGTGNGQGAGVHKVSLTDGVFTPTQKKPQFDRGGRGISGPSMDDEHQPWKKRPAANHAGESNGVHRKSLHRWQGGGAGGGSGVHAPSLTWQQQPDLSGDSGAVGRGVHSARLHRSEGVYAYLAALADRLRRVRVCCGEWDRVLTPSVTTYIGVTGVLLDPPYKQTERSICYSEDHDVSADVRAWALEHGDDPNFRIALCGYAGEHLMPASWEEVPWKAHGGYSRSKRGVENRSRERIWFSPHCLHPAGTFDFRPEVASA